MGSCCSKKEREVAANNSIIPKNASRVGDEEENKKFAKTDYNTSSANDQRGKKVVTQEDSSKSAKVPPKGSSASTPDKFKAEHKFQDYAKNKPKDGGHSQVYSTKSGHASRFGEPLIIPATTRIDDVMAMRQRILDDKRRAAAKTPQVLAGMAKEKEKQRKSKEDYWQAKILTYNVAPVTFIEDGKKEVSARYKRLEDRLQRPIEIIAKEQEDTKRTVQESRNRLIQHAVIQEKNDLDKTRDAVFQEVAQKSAKKATEDKASKAKSQSEALQESNKLKEEREKLMKVDQKFEQEVDYMLKRSNPKEYSVSFSERFNLELMHRGAKETDLESIMSIFHEAHTALPSDWTVMADSAEVNSRSYSQAAMSKQGGINPVESKTVNYDLNHLLKILNDARTKPLDFAGVLRAKYLLMLDSLSCHKTTLRAYTEGKFSILAAIKDLETQSPLSKLQLDSSLCVAAYVQARRQALEGQVMDQNRSGQVLANLKRFAAVPDGAVVTHANLATTVVASEDIVANLLISDGDLSRRNRKALVGMEAKKVGVGLYRKTAAGPVYVAVILADDKVQGGKGSESQNKVKDLMKEAWDSKQVK
jgi:hypothetical protein